MKKILAATRFNSHFDNWAKVRGQVHPEGLSFREGVSGRRRMDRCKIGGFNREGFNKSGKMAEQQGKSRAGL
jgi:hypothetical protein